MKRLRRVAQGNYYNAEEIAKKNNKIVEETGSTDGCVGFNWSADGDSLGYWIIDPFMDETQRAKVDPVEYYGDAFLNSDFAK